MTSATPAAAIEDRLRANWTTTPIVLFDETTDAPKADDGTPVPWVALEFPGGVGDIWGYGDPGNENHTSNNLYKETGAFNLHVFVPSGTGDKVAREYADQVSAIFRGKAFAVSVTCYAPFPPRQRLSPDGNYFGVFVSVPYSYQFFG